MKRKPLREQVFSAETEKEIKRWAKSVSQKAVWGNKNTLTNAAGQTIIKVNRVTLTGPKNGITQITYKKGSIDRNYYGADGKQTKQVSNHNHGNASRHPFGINGEHVHDYYTDKDGKLTHGNPGN